MKKKLTIFLTLLLVVPVASISWAKKGTDEIQTDQGPLKIHLLGHGSLMFQFDGKTIHVDPVTKMADYSKLPKADLILITHEHGDHADRAAVSKIKKEDTEIVLSSAASKKIKQGSVVKNGDTITSKGINIEVVPAYNIVHMRSGNTPFHPKGRGNGYILTLGGKRIYVAGDTENTPEMKGLKDIDVAFLPINLPYTMNADMVADAVKAFKPTILYPYHYDMGESQLPYLDKAMKGVEGVEVRVP